MARVIALTRTAQQHFPLEALRSLAVGGCALALIAAHPLRLFGF